MLRGLPSWHGKRICSTALWWIVAGPRVIASNFLGSLIADGATVSSLGPVPLKPKDQTCCDSNTMLYTTHILDHTGVYARILQCNDYIWYSACKDTMYTICSKLLHHWHQFPRFRPRWTNTQYDEYLVVSLLGWLFHRKACCEPWVSSFWARHSMTKSPHNDCFHM